MDFDWFKQSWIFIGSHPGVDDRVFGGVNIVSVNIVGGKSGFSQMDDIGCRTHDEKRLKQKEH